LLGHDLEGDKPIEQRLAGFLNRAHTTLAELGDDLEARKSLACEFRHKQPLLFLVAECSVAAQRVKATSRNKPHQRHAFTVERALTKGGLRPPGAMAIAE
jgi:hypothetical protein